MDSSVLISARNLSKHYGNFVAVDSINFNISARECFGFLGPNGAGKTTTAKMISCLSPVSEGELWVNRKNVNSDQREIKRYLGLVSQVDSLDPDLNVLQNLVAYARFFNIPKSIRLDRIWKSLKFFHLEEKTYAKPDELSGGMRRRLLLVRALINDPSILILDEPTTGLDPQTRNLVWSKLKELKDQGMTIILTTHHMEEARHLCDRLVVMDYGRILVEGEPNDLVHSYIGEDVLEIQCSDTERSAICEMLEAKNIRFEHAELSIHIYDKNKILSADDVADCNFQVTRRPANLEDVFLQLTGRGIRES